MIADYISPTFYNKKIQEINDDLEALIWIENVYPLAKVGVDEEGTFPEVYKNDGSRKSERLFPHGNSMSFFTMSDAQQIEESEMYTVNLSLIVWADMTKVTPSKTYDYTTELLKDVKGVLDDHSAYDYTIDFDNVFDGFDQLEKVENQNTMFPFTAFKITFTVDLLICS